MGFLDDISRTVFGVERRTVKKLNRASYIVERSIVKSPEAKALRGVAWNLNHAGPAQKAVRQYNVASHVLKGGKIIHNYERVNRPKHAVGGLLPPPRVFNGERHYIRNKRTNIRRVETMPYHGVGQITRATQPGFSLAAGPGRNRVHQPIYGVSVAGQARDTRNTAWRINPSKVHALRKSRAIERIVPYNVKH